MSPIYRKTEAARDALRHRGRLAPRERTLLVLVNGRHSVADLQRMIGPEANAGLVLMLEQGLIEPGLAEAADGPSSWPASAAPSMPPSDFAASAPVAGTASAPGPDTDADPPAAPPAANATYESDTLRQAQVRALELLRVNFGPGGDELAQPLLEARSTAAFTAALKPLQDKLAVYQGRKRAAELIASLRA